MPLSRLNNFHFRRLPHRSPPDMVLRTVFTVQMPTDERVSTPLHSGSSVAQGLERMKYRPLARDPQTYATAAPFLNSYFSRMHI
ncbi:hypothetical protein TNCV_163521 [Trichonephila clavipes]|nr:hypothetical protein TNCV_163521 [Trichonephila clavipes]